MSICIECNCTSSTFDEVLGETVCDDCGLVQVVRPFEETVSYISSKDKYIPTKDNDSSKGLGSYIMETNTRNGFALKRQHIRARPVTETEKEPYYTLECTCLTMMLLKPFATKFLDYIVLLYQIELLEGYLLRK